MKTILALALMASASLLECNAATVGWGSQETNSLGLENGSLAPQGSLVRLGYFTVSDSQVQLYAAAGNKTNLNSAFQEFGSSTVGAGYGLDGVWSDSALNANPTFANKQIYYWTLNAATLAAATQWGVFTNPTLAAWKFPVDPSPGFTNTDLGQVPHDGTGLIVGSFGDGPDENFGAPLYEMTAIPGVEPVPEPSTFAYGALAGLVAVCSWKRRRR